MSFLKMCEKSLQCKHRPRIVCDGSIKNNVWANAKTFFFFFLSVEECSDVMLLFQVGLFELQTRRVMTYREC